MTGLPFVTILVIIILILISIPIYLIFFSPKSQLLGKVIYEVKTNKKIVALTFDDGPNEPYTSQILEILAKYNIKATFFPVGENIVRESDALKKMTEAGHEIGIHSYSHAFFKPIISLTYKDEILKSQTLIKKITGQTPTLFRPPWFFRTSSMLKSVKALDLTPVTGTFGSFWEVFKVSPQKIASDGIKNTKPGTILVFHDGYNNRGTNRNKTVQAVAILVPKLIQDGYKFMTVSELLKQTDLG